MYMEYSKQLLNFDILWRHIVVGFYLDRSETTKIYNSCISYIAYKIYQSKIYRRIEHICHRVSRCVYESQSKYWVSIAQWVERWHGTPEALASSHGYLVDC